MNLRVPCSLRHRDAAPAGPTAAITVARAQQLITRVADLSVWEVILANWQARYAQRPGGPNWAHFEGLLERYTREASSAAAARSGGSDCPDWMRRLAQESPHIYKLGGDAGDLDLEDAAAGDLAAD